MSGKPKTTDPPTTSQRPLPTRIYEHPVMQAARKAVRPITFREEVEKVTLFLVIFSGYFLIQLYGRITGIEPHLLVTGFDRAFPFVPAWCFVYFTYWIFMMTPLFWVRERSYFRRTFWAYLATLLVAYATFLVFPTMVPRPELPPPDSFTIFCMHWLYDADEPVNAFPSLHVALSFLCALSLLPIARLIGRLALVWAAGVALSTMFIKQHVVADVAAGALLAGATHWLIQRPYRVQTRHLPRQLFHRSPLWLLAVLAAQAGFMLYLYLKYRGVL